MSIIANINPLQTAMSNRLILIGKDGESYGNALLNEYQDANSSSSDHFISTFKDIDRVAKEYTDELAQGADGNVSAVLNNIVRKIHNTRNLSRWLISVMCAFIYGCDEGQDLDVQSVAFEENDSANPGNYIPALQMRTRDHSYIPATQNAINNGQTYQLDYLRIFKGKFKTANGNFNNYNSFPQDVNDHGLNVLSFAQKKENYDYIQTLGTFSSRHFVIPMKEDDLNGWNNQPTWKKKYQELCSAADRFLTELQTPDKLLSIRERVLLRLSAQSIGAGASAAMLLVKALLEKYVSLDVGGTIVSLKTVPWYKKLCGVQLYKINDSVDLEKILNKTIYMGYESKRYYALYPFSEVLVTALKNKKCTISNISLDVEKNPNDVMDVQKAVLSFDYTSKFLFLQGRTVGGTFADTSIEVPGTKIYTYDEDHIVGIQSLRTLCMYPNLPQQYEGNCQKYHYLSLEDADIMLGTLTNPRTRNIDLYESRFVVRDANGQKSIILDMENAKNIDEDHNGAQLPGVTAIKVFEDKSGTKKKIYTTEVNAPEHFIEVCGDTESYGYIMNIVLPGYQTIPPLLEESPGQNQFAVNMDVVPQAPSAGTLRAYVDFGSSSSCVRYLEPGHGANLQDQINPESILRMLLVGYGDIAKSYQFVINMPGLNSLSKFQSISAMYNENSGIKIDYLPYRESYMPVTNNLREYIVEGLSTDVSHKTDLVDGGVTVVSPWVIIHNICYLVACNAASKGYGTVYIIPSIPSKKYQVALKNAWNDAIATVANGIFGFGGNFVHTLNTNNEKCLYESIAISSNQKAGAANELMIAIDIGDGTTDMSAIVVDNNERNVCGYSSVEYAGKNLIKQTIKDIMNAATVDNARIILAGAHGYPSLFRPKKPENQRAYDTSVTNLLTDFFDSNGTRKAKPDEKWENDVIDILSVATLNNDIDQKIAANLIARYALLMPVIRDFILTAIKIANSPIIKTKKDEYGAPVLDADGNPVQITEEKKRLPEGSNITITFYGGSAKGLNLLNLIDKRGSKKAWDLIEQYFKNELTKCGQYNIATKVSQLDGKDVLVKGLSALTVTPPANAGGLFNIAISGVLPDTDDDAIKWAETVDPCATEYFGQPTSVHKEAAPGEATETDKEHQEKRFVSVLEMGNSVPDTTKANTAKIETKTFYFHNEREGFDKLKAYFEDELYKKLIDNHDNMPDAIETVLIDFLDTNRHTRIYDSAIKELNGPRGSFVRGSKSSIYPEMVLDTVFMFAISELLALHHGSLPDIAGGHETMLNDAGAATPYKFGDILSDRVGG